MIIKRKNKYFSDLTPIQQEEKQTPEDLKKENLKMQRQIMINNKARNQMINQQELNKNREVSKIQAVEKEKEKQDMAEQMRLRQQDSKQKAELLKQDLYKVKSVPNKPVSMN